MEFRSSQEPGERESMKRTIAFATALLLGSATLLSWGQDAAKDTPAAQASYKIGADDTLHVSVWKEPDLTATLPVRADGMISLPLLNDVQAAGLTPMQLAANITEKLKKYLADPRVTVVVTAMNSQRVYVIGEVLHTGAMNLLPGMTVLQA